MNQNLTIAENYYKAMLEKDFEKMGAHLHDEIHWIGPSSEMHGKEAVVTAARNFAEVLQDIRITSRFSSGHEIMLAYDMVLPAPIGSFRAAVRMDFEHQLISKIELFYDTSPFQAKK